MFIQVNAQKNNIWWFDAGVKAQYGATGLYNKAIADSGEFGYEISTGSSYGGKLGINYGYGGLAIDVMFSTASSEVETNPSQINLQTKYKSIDFYTLYRNSQNLGYFEIGPKFSLINEVTSGLTGEDPTDVTNFYKSNEIAAVVGFGAYFFGNDGRFSGIIGLRFEYGITDMVNGDGHAVGAPSNSPSLYLEGVESSHPIFAGITFELNWGIGYFGQARCGERSKFMMF